MPLRGRWRAAGRAAVVVIGAAGFVAPVAVWAVTNHDVAWLWIEELCQFVITVAVLARVLHLKRVSGWLDRVGLGPDNPPESLDQPGET